MTIRFLAFLFCCLSSFGAAFPLKVSPGNHYIVDQNGAPFFIFGDAPWYIIQNLQQPDVDYYLSNKWVQGYNCIEFAPNENSRTDAYGNIAWTNASGGYTNLASINVDFWTNVDYFRSSRTSVGEFGCFLGLGSELN
jgi:hypothetical protein